jgi:hypothetical protein
MATLRIVPEGTTDLAGVVAASGHLFCSFFGE